MVSSEVAGLWFQVGSGACLALMGSAVKFAGKAGIPLMEIVFARSLVLVAQAVFMMRKLNAEELPWRSPRRCMLLLRGVVGTLGVTSYYWAVTLLPLSDALVLSMLAPLFVALAAPLALGERTGRGVWLALPPSFVGILLVAQPTFLFGAGAAALSSLGVAVGISQAVIAAASNLVVRHLGSTEPVASLMFAMAAVSGVASGALCVLLPGQFVAPPSAAACGLMLAAGLMACGTQLTATMALKLSRAAPVTLVSYLSVVWGLLNDLLLFRHTPSLLGLLGSALVCCSSLLIFLVERGIGGGSSRHGGGSSRHGGSSAAAGSPPGLTAGSSGALAEAVSKAVGAAAAAVAAEAEGTPQQRRRGEGQLRGLHPLEREGAALQGQQLAPADAATLAAAAVPATVTKGDGSLASLQLVGGGVAPEAADGSSSSDDEHAPLVAVA